MVAGEESEPVELSMQAVRHQSVGAVGLGVDGGVTYAGGGANYTVKLRRSAVGFNPTLRSPTPEQGEPYRPGAPGSY